MQVKYSSASGVHSSSCDSVSVLKLLEKLVSQSSANALMSSRACSHGLPPFPPPSLQATQSTHTTRTARTIPPGAHDSERDTPRPASSLADAEPAEQRVQDLLAGIAAG